MKRGFTLIELLGVIVVIAVIAVIATRVIGNVITSFQTEAYLNSQKSMEKAASLYLSTHSEELPTVVGSQVEISLTTLQASNLLKTIRDPKNASTTCSGYVTVMKLGENNFDYTPNLKCGSASGIDSAASDGLLASYKFNDYDEPTVNLAPYPNYENRNYNQAYAAAGWSGDAATIYYYGSGGYNNLAYKKMIKTAGGAGGVYLDDNVGILIEDNKTYTVSGWMKASSDVVVNGYALDINRGSDNKYITNGGSFNLTTNWQRYSWTFTTGVGDAGVYQSRHIIYLDDNLPLEVYWSGFQVEQKANVTNYTLTSRLSKVTDYSGNNILGYMSNQSFPTFNKDEYIFDGNDEIIGSNVEAYSVRSNSDFTTNYAGYLFESVWTPTIVPGGILRLTVNASGYHGSFGGEAANFITGRTYKVTMRIRHQTNTGTQSFRVYNTTNQGAWPSVTVNKSTAWQEVSFYMTGHNTYGGWINSSSGLVAGEYYEIDYLKYDLLANTNTPLQTPNVTVMGWINTSNKNLQTIVNMPQKFTSANTAPLYGYGLSTLNNRVIYNLSINGIDRSFTAGSITDNTWHHVALTFDGTTRKGFVDGELVESLSNYVGDITYANSANLVIGTRSEIHKGDYYNGKLDNIKVYNRALADEEIAKIYASEKK